MKKLLKLLLLASSESGEDEPRTDLSLANASKLFNWYTGAGDVLPATLWEDDAGGYKQATDGAALKRWTDTIAAYAPIQATLANRPIVHLGGFGTGDRSYIEFGGDDNLVLTVANGIIGTLGVPAFTLYCVMSTVSTNTSKVYYSEGRSSSNTPQIIGRMNNATAGNYRSDIRTDDSTSGTPASTGLSLNDGNPHLLITEYTNAAINIYRDRVSAASATVSVTLAGKAITIDRISIGAVVNTGTGSYFEGKLALLYAHLGTRDATDRTAICDYYGIA